MLLNDCCDQTPGGLRTLVFQLCRAVKELLLKIKNLVVLRMLLSLTVYIILYMYAQVC